ncbi:hypothetical protein QBC35DRAFT_553068 [Podospora australis]|uniref:Uncharacterized protein n=1 Tax=Podospora australis TaxID=1536484 RepID=A0AAN6WSN8_9PEZI|nr:hypothetical protein QBC35DRAFT_553068 [Podospora australis]
MPYPNNYQPPEPSAALKEALGFSSNYKGSILDPKNQSANIQQNQSCSFFITKLWPGTTVQVLLQALSCLGPIDRICATSVNPPDHARSFNTTAAKIVTFTRPGAERLYNLINEGMLVIHGFVAKAVWNRVLVPPQELPENFSQVLIFSGHPFFVTEAFLTLLFQQNGIEYDSQVIKTTLHTQFAGTTQDAKIEWQFGSYRAQASAAKSLVEKKGMAMKVKFGEDPCVKGIGNN